MTREEGVSPKSRSERVEENRPIKYFLLVLTTTYWQYSIGCFRQQKC